MNFIHRVFCRSSLWRHQLENKLLPWVLGDAELGEDVLEVGPGPGLVTDALRKKRLRLSSIEIDPKMARALRRRLPADEVDVVEGDATRMRFADGRFSSALSFTMLHHVPSEALQDRLFAEVRRVLRPGGLFLGSDSLSSRSFEWVHYRDTLVPVDPAGLAERLEAAGFEAVEVEVARKGARSFRFKAQRPREARALPERSQARQGCL